MKDEHFIKNGLFIQYVWVINPIVAKVYDKQGYKILLVDNEYKPPFIYTK
jgi:hypothetical protein